jgi:hypothetical protein
MFDVRREVGGCFVTFDGELDSMDKMLIQTELTVIAGDHESYSISAHKRTSHFIYRSCKRNSGPSNIFTFSNRMFIWNPNVEG